MKWTPSIRQLAGKNKLRSRADLENPILLTLRKTRSNRVALPFLHVDFANGAIAEPEPLNATDVTISTLLPFEYHAASRIPA